MSGHLVLAQRVLAAFALAASLWLPVFGSSVPARAAAPRDPDARLQFVVKQIDILDDTDLLGGGEMRLLAVLLRLDPSFPGSGEGLSGYEYSFDASSGNIVGLDRVSPRDGDTMRGGATPEAGIPVYDDQQYRLAFSILERDPFDAGNDWMGSVDVAVDPTYGWGIGTFKVRSRQEDGSDGDYVLTYEIRRTPLPDLVDKSTWATDSAGDVHVCGDIRNVGQRPSATAHLTVWAEGLVVETFNLPALDVDWTYPHCIQRGRLPAHQHDLMFSIDEERTVLEMEEHNNVGVLTVAAGVGTVPVAAPVTAPSPQPKTAEEGREQPEAQADLTVKAIWVNGQVPDGKDDCKEGKNAITVTVKNGGPGDADRATVRLLVDGEAHEKTVKGLDAGQEREVRFENVALKQGEHTLVALVTSRQAPGETDEEHDTKVTVRCQSSRGARS